MEIERRVAREARAMTRNEVIVKAIAGELKWYQAAMICGVSDRQMRRLKRRWEEHGYDGLVDGRSGRPRRRRIAVETIEQLCRLRRERYMEFSVQHFWEKATEEHGIEISYTWAKLTLQAAGLANKAPGRGKYRRRRPRRAMRGMMMHLDASTHRWIEDLPMWDLVLMLDDADGEILYGRFVPEEGTLSTMEALRSVLRTHGRFCELYTDRGSHFCHTAKAGEAASTEHDGQVSRALKALGIRQILAYSPQARGRGERVFGTVQGRLPQELKAAGVTNYEDANVYLERRFIPDFNRRFTVEPADPASAFVPIHGIDLELLLSVQHERVVQNDSTVSLAGLTLQLPKTRSRAHYVRCPVIVHQFPDDTLAVSYQGQLLARYDRDGTLTHSPISPKRRRSSRGEKAAVALRAPSASSPRDPAPPLNNPKTTESPNRKTGHL
jgi:transposase